MSDQQSTPPKPKPGSLRDRIAAFEKGGSANPASAPAPVPRAKPAGFASWKPKAPSPPSTPSAPTSTADHGASSSKALGGMSASDAKESIVKGGSLKERMAALQGKGAFGAPPPVAPKPPLEKPKWKPPPVISAPIDDDDDHETIAREAGADAHPTSPPHVSIKSEEADGSKSAESEEISPAAAEGEASTEALSEEEEERQRRAAIAARLARLGGARIGMAPPVFGKKPVPPPAARKPSLDAGKVGTSKEVSSPPLEHYGGVTQEPVSIESKPPVVAEDIALVSSPPSDGITAASPPSQASRSADYFPTRKNSESASLLSVDSAESHNARSPSSMPVPAVPRRAAPPRKKASKSPASPPVVSEVTEETAAASVEVVAERDEAAVKADEVAPESEEKPSGTQSNIDAELGDVGDESKPVETIEEEETSVVDGDVPGDLTDNPNELAEVVTSTFSEVEPIAKPLEIEEEDVVKDEATPEPAEKSAPEEEEDEEARRKRVAERIAKMGGINPFALPARPQRQPSQSSGDAQSPSLAVLQPNLETSPEPPKRQDLLKALETSHSPSEPSESTANVNKDNADTYKPRLAAQESEEFQDNASHAGQDRVEDESESEYETDGDEQAATDNDKETGKPVQTSRHERQEESESNEDEPTQESSLSNSIPSIPVPPPRVRHGELPHPPAQPPRQIVPFTPEPEDESAGYDDESDQDEELSRSQLFVPPPRAHQQSSAYVDSPRRLLARNASHDDDTDNETPLPIPHRKSLESYAAETNTREDHASHAPPRRNLPPPPSRPPPVDESDEDESGSDDGAALPVRPMESPDVLSRPGGESTPLFVLPPQSLLVAEQRSPVSASHPRPVQRPLPNPPTFSAAPSSQQQPSVPLQAQPSLTVPKEIIDEEEGDPIDPSFHSPSRRASAILPPSTGYHFPSDDTPTPTQNVPTSPPVVASSSAAEQREGFGENVEIARRRTIAERMAKLGGIKFGAAPPVSGLVNHPPPRREDEDLNPENDETDATEQKPIELTDEEEESARKERIAAKLAGMGGMRIGMMPMGAGFPPRRSHVLRDEEPASTPALATSPPRRAVPPPVRSPPPQATQVREIDSEQESLATSEDGVKVEAEDSEIEEVRYEDIEDTPPSPPPPVPSRATRPTRRESSDVARSPPPSAMRPPVPSTLPTRRLSGQSMVSPRRASGDSYQPQRKSSNPKPQSEYVMVDEPRSIEADDPPPPPARPAHRAPPTRSPPPLDSNDSISSQWELPSIPNSSLEFGGGDLAMSWTDAEETTAESMVAFPPAPLPGKAPQQPKVAPSDVQLDADQLMAVWGRVGVQICEVATSFFEKSKRALVGDGTYAGFVSVVLKDVPNASQYTGSSEYGYLVYQQVGAAVQKRASEIMPGDIVELNDAKLKGHKGIHVYNQVIGGNEPLVGVISEFEPKKSKIRVFHANQHVGQQTVESVSYRLEDLKSGTVKVYRVLEA